jgi:hypothetical protein
MSEVTTPKLTQAPLKVRDTEAEAKAYTEEILNRMGAEGIAKMESQIPYVADKPGWTRRWALDLGDNLPRRLADGWRFVDKKEGPETSLVLGAQNTDVGDQVSFMTNAGGQPCRQVLIEIPTELAEKILDVRSYSKGRAVENAIVNGGLGDTTQRYIPGDTPGSAFFGTRNKIGRQAAA